MGILLVGSVLLINMIWLAGQESNSHDQGTALPQQMEPKHLAISEVDMLDRGSEAHRGKAKDWQTTWHCFNSPRPKTR